MDQLRLNGIAVDCVIGDLPQEREREQRLVVDVQLHMDLAAAAARDDLDDTVDYVTLVARIRAVLREAKCRLVERAADLVARTCLEEARVMHVVAAVRKAGCVSGLASAEVVVERSK